jgi:hypothetical protein
VSRGALLIAVSLTASSGARSVVAQAVETTQVAVGTWVGLGPSGYSDEGRRDPFVSLLVDQSEPDRSRSGQPPSALSAVSISEVRVSGIAGAGGSLLAILEVSSSRSFVARPGDRLADGLVETIDREGVVFAVTRATNGPPTVRKPLKQTGIERR